MLHLLFSAQQIDNQPQQNVAETLSEPIQKVQRTHARLLSRAMATVFPENTVFPTMRRLLDFRVHEADRAMAKELHDKSRPVINMAKKVYFAETSQKERDEFVRVANEYAGDLEDWLKDPVFNTGMYTLRRRIIQEIAHVWIEINNPEERMHVLSLANEFSSINKEKVSTRDDHREIIGYIRKVWVSLKNKDDYKYFADTVRYFLQIDGIKFTHDYLKVLSKLWCAVKNQKTLEIVVDITKECVADVKTVNMVPIRKPLSLGT